MKKKTFILILALSLLCAGLFGFLTSKKYVEAQEYFDDSGYILGTTAGEEVGDERYYFEKGSKYQHTYEGSITLNDINKNKVSIDSKSFVHYDNGSLFGLNDSVLMDTDDINDNQISYYSISSDSILSKSGNSYVTSNAGSEVDFSNFIWKISNERYMVVSDKIILFASDKNQQEFEDYIELEYVDAGVVRLVNKEGTYSTISSDAYLELSNGYRLYLGSKNVSDGEAIVMNLTEMVVNSDDNIEIIPDETYKKENLNQPQIIVNATDGEDGAEGESGNEGDEGEASGDGADGNYLGSLGNGDNGRPGETYYQASIAGKMLKEDGVSYYEDTEEDYQEWYDKVLSGDNGKTYFEEYIKGQNIDGIVYDDYDKWYKDKLTGETGDDGAGGKAGDEGDPGDPGSKGNQGAAGTAGTVGETGDQGNDADNSGIAYIEDVMPYFGIDGDLNVTAYSVDGLIEYDNTYKDLDGVEQSITMGSGKSVTYMIIDTETSNIVWQRTLDPSTELSLTDPNYLTGTALTGAVHTLKQNTQYSLVINATYEPVSYVDGESYSMVTRQVFNQPFTTLGYGVDMSLDHTTEHEIFMNIKIDKTAIDTMNSFDVDLYNSQRELMDYANDSYSFEIVSANVDPELFDRSTNNTISLEDLTDDLDYPIELQVKFSSSASNEIKKNTVYYGKINVNELINKDDKSAITIYPPDSLDFVRAKTHKTRPTIAVPVLTAYDNVNAVSVMPGAINDPDGGLKSYRYVFYEVIDGHVNRDNIIHTVEKNTAESFSLKVYEEGDADNSTNLLKGHTYVCETIGIFDNNEYLEQINSGESDPVDLTNSSIWPEVTFNFNVYQYYKDKVEEARRDEFQTIYDRRYKDKSSPNVVEGTITIEDIGDIIDETSELVISYISESGDESLTDSYAVPVSDATITKVSQSGHLVYTMPFAFTNMKEGTDYKLNLSVNHAIIRDPDNPTDYRIESGVKIGTGYTSTASYMPLYFSGVSCDEEDIDNEAFKVNLYFSLDPDKYIEQEAIKVVYSDYVKSILGIEDTIDLSAKSLHSVSLDLFKINSATDEPMLSNGKLNESPLVVYFPTTYNTSEHSESDNKSYYDNWYKHLNSDDFYGVVARKSVYETVSDTEDVDVYASAYIKEDMASYTYNSDRSNILNANMPETVDGNEVYYTITISDKSFVNDDSLSNLIADYRKSNPGLDIMIRATLAYDHTYAKGIKNIQPFANANTIQIGEAADSEYTNDLYDRWVSTDIHETVPEWRTDKESYFKIKELPKNYYKNGVLYEEEEAHKCYSNLMGNADDKAALTAYWRENVSGTTTVGYVIQGNSSWLASYANAVRYSVYDMEGNLITRSYNDDETNTATVYLNDGVDGTVTYTYGADGWIKCTDSMKLPEWVLYMNQSTYTVGTEERTLKRGDQFKVEMEILLKDISYKVGENVYSYLYPYNYDESHEKHIINDYLIPKQMPSILMAQYDGSTSGNNDQYYAFIKDTDKALEYNNNKLVVYCGSDDSKILIEVGEAQKVVTTPVIPFLYKITYDSHYETMNVRYSLDNRNNGTIRFASDNRLNKGSSIMLQDINIIEMNKVMLNIGDPTRFDETKDWGKVLATNDSENSIIRIYAESDCDSETFKSSVKSVKVDFTNGNPDADRTGRSNTLSFTFDISDIEKGGFHSFTDGTTGKDHIIFRMPEIEYSDLANICNTLNYTEFNVDVTLCYETDNYGLKYADRTLFGSLEDRRYLLEPNKDLSIGAASNTLYELGDVVIAKTKEVVSGASDYDDEYKVNIFDNVSHEIARSTIDMYSAGLENIPREILFSKASKADVNQLIIQAVIPDATITETKKFGMYSGAFSVQLSSKGTIVTENGITVKLDRGGGNVETINLAFDGTYPLVDEARGLTIEYNEETLTWNIESHKLVPNSEYTISVNADFRSSATTTEQKELNTLDVETLKELEIASSALYRVVNDASDRSKKTVTERVVFNNLYLSDVQVGVSSVSYRVNNTTPGHEELIAKNDWTKDEFIKELIRQNYPECTTDAAISAKIEEMKYVPWSYTLSHSMNWAPDASGKHVLGENWQYKGYIDINYGGSNQTRNINAVSNFNDELELVNPFRAIASMSQEQVGNKYTINYEISGNDAKRILVGNNTVSSDPDNDNDVTYVLELHKRNSDGEDTIIDVEDATVAEGKEVVTLAYPSFEKVAPDYSGEDYYTDAAGNKYVISGYTTHDVYLFTSDMVNKSGNEGANINPKSFTIMGDSDSAYYVKVYCIADIYNLDIQGITKDGAIHNVTYKVEEENVTNLTFDALYNFDIVDAEVSGVFVEENGSVKTPYYVYIGGEIKTPSNPNVDIEAINLSPQGDTGIVEISGNYLYKVAHVRYQLTEVVRSEGEDVYHEYELYPETGHGSGDIWKQSAGGSKTYNLLVNNMSNPGNKYFITVYLYVIDAAGTGYELAATVEGVYTPSNWN